MRRPERWQRGAFKYRFYHVISITFCRLPSWDDHPADNSFMSDTLSVKLPHVPAPRDQEELRAARFAMRMSLAVGVLMLVGKTAAYFMTGSAAILSDFAESVVHVIAVAFAAFSLRLSTKPAGPTFPYGYERITFFSAGFEGAMIVVAALWILVEAIEKWIAGLQLEHLGAGTLLLLAAGTLNGWLGWYLLRVGKRSSLADS